MPSTVTFLGTAAAVPGARHDTASFVINAKYLVDTGWYANYKLLIYGIDPLSLEYLCFTHLHLDHCLGLPQLLLYRNRKQLGVPPLKIVGPAQGLRMSIERVRQFLWVDRYPECEPNVCLVPLKPGEAYGTDAFCVETHVSSHDIPGLIYRFTDKNTNAVIAFTGDTAYEPEIADHVRGAGLLIHDTALGPDGVGSKLHSNALDAARVAQAAGVRRLALIHCPESAQQAAVKAARTVFPNTFYPEEGETVEVAAL